MKRIWISMLCIFCLGLLPACGSSEAAYIDKTPLMEVELEEEAAILAAAPGAVPGYINGKTAEGKTQKEKRSDKAVINYTNADEGFVQAQFVGKTTKRLKAQVKGPAVTYTYNMTAGKQETFPLSDGNGSYQVTVYENTTEQKYAVVCSVTFDVKLQDEFAPFMHSNQYVDYAVAPKTIAKAKELTANVADPLKKVEKVYDYVVGNMTYDTAKAATVTSGYLPVLDDVLAAKKGICFDYASLMTGMLRSQGVPCKLVVGYAGTAYHAWISVWTEETGWVDGVIYFDGHAWHRMDPTFASSGKQSDAIMKYIGDGKNYTVKYLY